MSLELWLIEDCGHKFVNRLIRPQNSVTNTFENIVLSLEFCNKLEKLGNGIISENTISQWSLRISCGSQ